MTILDENIRIAKKIPQPIILKIQSVPKKVSNRINYLYTISHNRWIPVPLQRGNMLICSAIVRNRVHCIVPVILKPCWYPGISFIFLLFDTDISPKGVLKKVKRNCKIGAQRLPLLPIIDLETTNDLPDIPFHSKRGLGKFEILSSLHDTREIFFFVPAFQFWRSFNWEFYNFMIR